MLTTMLMLVAATQATPPAPPAPPAETGKKVISEVVVVQDGGKDSKAERKTEQRRIVIMRQGKDAAAAAAHAEHMAHQTGDHAMMIATCNGGTKISSDAAGEQDGKKTETRIMVCAKGENQLAALEQAQKRIAENKDIPDNVRSTVLAQLSAEIARLKAAK